MKTIRVIRNIYTFNEEGHTDCDDLRISNIMTIVNPISEKKTEEVIHSNCIDNLIDYILYNIWNMEIRNVTEEDKKYILSLINFKEVTEKKESIIHTIIQGTYIDEDNDDKLIFKYQTLI